MNQKKSPTTKQITSTQSRVRMLTPSEIESLRLDNLMAHKRMQELIAEAKKKGPLVLK